MAQAAQRGRPAGPAQSTIAKAREATARLDELCPPMTLTAAGNQVAREFGVGLSTIWNWRALLTGPSVVDAETQSAPAPRPKPRMSQRTLLYRAWIAMRLIDVFRVLGDAVAMFWINTVLQIGELGEDGVLSFGAFGDAYRSRRELAEAAGRTETELDDLIHRGLLTGLEGGGLALPVRFGLRPREPLGGDLAMPMIAVPHRPSRGPDPRQTSLPPMGMPRRDSREIQPADSRENAPPTAENPAGDSSKIQPDDSRKNPLAGGEEGTTTTTTKDESLFSGGGLSSAGVPETANFARVDSGKNPPVSDEPPTLVTLAYELLTIVGRPPHPSAAELTMVRAWLDAGATVELIRDVARSRMARARAPSQPALTYFDQIVRERLGALPAVAPAPPAAPAPSPEDQAVAALVKPSSDAYGSDRGCPFPPGVASLKAACAAGNEPLAHRWLAAWDAWNAAGRPGRAKPPDFTDLVHLPARFEADLDRVEEELTEPPHVA